MDTDNTESFDIVIEFDNKKTLDDLLLEILLDGHELSDNQPRRQYDTDTTIR